MNQAEKKSLHKNAQAHVASVQREIKTVLGTTESKITCHCERSHSGMKSMHVLAYYAYTRSTSFIYDPTTHPQNLATDHCIYYRTRCHEFFQNGGSDPLHHD